MGSCWFCHWGWPEPVVEIYRRHMAVAGEEAMHFGPAHIVWEDENFGRDHVQWCVDNFDDYREGHSSEELAAVAASLRELLALPEGVLDPRPDNYPEDEDSDFNPADYPPRPGIKMVRT